ncbi:MAG: CHAD domain-containing protein [Gammaproteobacteria bacterium]
MNRPEVITPPAEGISQAVVDVIDDLQQRLRLPEHDQTNIHRIRVDIKRLRAWLRLVSKDAGFDWRAANRRLRDQAKCLSPCRDAQVIMDTLRWLRDKSAGGDRGAVELLMSRLHFDAGEPIAWDTLQAPLAEAAESLREPALALHSDDIVRRGLKRCYRRAVREGKRAFSLGGTIEDLHELRKWVKYLYYQLGYVDKTRPGCYPKTRKRLDKLGDKLGRIHDLDLIRNRAEQLYAAGDCAEAAARVAMLVDERMDRLMKSCRRLYRKGLHASPSGFVRPLA